MDLVVDDVTGDDQADRRDVQSRGAVGAGVAQIDRDQLLAFQAECVTSKRLADDGRYGDLLPPQPHDPLITTGRQPNRRSRQASVRRIR